MFGRSFTFIAFFALVSSGSCGKPESREAVLELGEFAPYVARFEQDANSKGVTLKVTDLKIRFGRMDSPYERGICDFVEGETPTITLKKSAWDQLTEEEREALLFHEMGHCVLRRKHKPDLDSDGRPVSLMYPYAIDRETYLGKQDHYLNELVAGRGEF